MYTLEVYSQIRYRGTKPGIGRPRIDYKISAEFTCYNRTDALSNGLDLVLLCFAIVSPSHVGMKR